jgi:carboxyl-terminal processing protease
MALLILGVVASLSSTPAAAGDEPPWREAYLESFDQIWTTVQQTYWDPDIGGLDWEAVRAELRPQVASATSPAEARQVMREMIGRLGQSHFALIASELTPELTGTTGEDDGPSPDSAASETSGHGETGMVLRSVGDEALVVSVVPGSPAAEAGIRPGWRLDAIDGEPVRSLITEVAGAAAGTTGIALLTSVALRARLAGPEGATRHVRLDDGTGQAHELELRLGPPRGTLARLGHMPAIPTWIEWRILDPETASERTADAGSTGSPGVGYVAFSAFLDPGHVMGEYGTAMRRFLKEAVDGVIIDLRGNPGGIGAMAMGMAGWLVRGSGHRLGTMTTRDTTLDFVIFPRPQTFDGPVAVIVDGLSASTSEILAGGLKDVGRARIFGTTSAGMALPSQIEPLPSGDAFQHAFADYVTTSGVRLEGRGVVPDQEVALERGPLLAGHDAPLEAALAWIEATSRAGTTSTEDTADHPSGRSATPGHDPARTQGASR